MLPTHVRRIGRPLWYSPLDTLREDFDQVLGRWFDQPEAPTTGLYPVDIREDKDNVYVEAELPGFTRDQIELTFENGVLSLVALRKPQENEKAQCHLNERRYTRVARSFTLPNTVDEQHIDAKLENGVLRLTLHKRDEVKPRRIEVK